MTTRPSARANLRGSGTSGLSGIRVLRPLAWAILLAGCGGGEAGVDTLHWYVFNEPSGAFREAAVRCSERSSAPYRIELVALPTDADQQREQLVRRLAARDPDIDLMGMDVIWTAEFAEAGWILPWPEEMVPGVVEGKLGGPVQSATYRGRLWGAPFTTNAQLLWYRKDRVDKPPATWSEMIHMAELLDGPGALQVQGERYEGLTVFFVSLLASAGGSVLEPAALPPSGDLSSPDPERGVRIGLASDPALQALEIMGRLGGSKAAAPNLDRAREDQGRRAFEDGTASFMVNYTYVWASARANAPEVVENMGWAAWPSVVPGEPSHVTVGGINLGVGAFSRHPELAFQAAACLSSEENQRTAAAMGGLPPSSAGLYDEDEVRQIFPFSDVLRTTLERAVQRPQSPLYNDISLAINRTLHPLSEIHPQTTLARLRQAVGRALRSEGLF